MFKDESNDESKTFFGALVPPMSEAALYDGQRIAPTEEWRLCVRLQNAHYDEFFDSTHGRVDVQCLVRQTATGGYCLVIVCQREGSGLQHRVILSMHDQATKELLQSLVHQRLVVRFQDTRGQHEELSQEFSRWAQFVLDSSANETRLSYVAELFGRLILIRDIFEPGAERSLFPEKEVREVGITVVQRRTEAFAPSTLQ